MNDILSLNESIFGNRIKEKRVSRKTRKVMSSELYVPEEAIVMSYEDVCSVDGGGTIEFGIKFTVGAVIGSSVVSSIVGFLSGYCVTKSLKFGALIGGFWGGVIGLAVGALLAGSIASIINRAVYAGASGVQTITLISISTGWGGRSDSYFYDLGNLLGVCIGGGVGFAYAYAQGSGMALAF